MSLFRYKVRDRFGAAVTGILDSPDSKSVAFSLRKLGYSIVDIEEQSNIEVVISDFFNKLHKVSKTEVILFTRQLSAMMRSGLPLITGLEGAILEMRDKQFKDVISQVKKDVEGGSSFNEALAKHPAVFSSLYVNMIKAGESAGILDDILERLSQLGMRDLELKSKIKAAFVYPIILSVLAIGVVTVLLTFVLPKFIFMFESSEMKLPMPTIILINISTFLSKYFILLVLGIIGAVMLFLRYIGTDKGRYNFHHFLLGLPLFGYLWLRILITRFAYTLSSLTKSGIPILRALSVVEGTVGNAVVVHALQHVRSSLSEGQSLADPFRASGLFPPMVIQMIAAGEKAGKIDAMLEDIANFYELETGYAIRNMTAMLEPLILLFMGIIVAFIALSVLLPIFNVVKAIQH